MATDPFADLIPKNAPKKQAIQNDDPFADLVPQQTATAQPTAQAPAMSPFMAHMVGFNTGVENLAHGLLQPVLESGALGDGIKQGSKDFAAQRQQDYAEAAKQYPKTAGISNVLGGIGATIPTFAIPGLGKSALTRLATQGALQGGLVGGAQYTNEGDSRLGNAALGAGLGGALGAGFGLAGQGATKLYNTFKGITDDPAADAVIAAGKQWKVPVFASDASQNIALKRAAEGFEEVPLLGMRGDRAGQMYAAKDAAEKLTDDAAGMLANTKFESLAQVKQVAKGKTPRAAAAQRLLEEVNTAGDDWQQILKTSGNLKLFRNKLIADEKYNKVSQVADKFGDVARPNTTKALDNALADVQDSILPDSPLIGKLGTIKENLASREFNYSQMRKARADIGDLISDFYTGSNAAVGSKGVGALQGLKNAIEDDMNAFASKNGRELSAAWRDADKFYRTNIVPAKDRTLAQALTKADPDEIYGKFIQRGDKVGRPQRFYNALDDKGRAAVRYGIVKNAYEKAFDGDRNLFSPAKFATAIKDTKGASGVFFKGAAKQELDGFANLMRHVERSRQAIDKPMTGVQNIPYLIGGGALGAAFLAPGATAAVAGSTVVFKKLLTTDSGRRFLLASSKLKPGSPTMQKLVEKAGKSLQAGIVLNATDNNKEPNNVTQ